MKKILSLTLLLAVIFAAFVFLPVQAEEDNNVTFKISEDGLTATTKNVTLEKIPSPEQIRYFKVIKKDGTSLWGIRLQKEGGNAIIKNDDSVKVTVRDQLEKILAPQYINLYNKITKIGDSLWGIPKKESPKSATSTRIITAEMAPCVGAAIDKKDSSIKAVIASSSVSLSAAIDLRGECQKKAIAVTLNQHENLNVCVKTFQLSSKEIATKAHVAQQEAWRAYQTALKACSLTATTTATTTAPVMIEDGGSASLDVVITQ